MVQKVTATVLCCCLSAACLVLLACAQTHDTDEPSARVVACVGKTQISSDQLAHWRSIIAKLSPEARGWLLPPAARTAQPALQARAFLSASSRAIEEANELGVSIPSSKVAAVLKVAELEEVYGSPDGPSRLLRRLQAIRGRVSTPQDRSWVTKVQLLEEAVEAHERAQTERAVTHAQALSYYRSHKRSFRTPERRDVAVIETFTKRKIELAKKEIESGHSFLSVMAARNDEPDVGGLKRGLIRSQLQHTYELSYFAAAPHVLVGPQKSEIYFMFEVMAVKPSRLPPVTEVEERIRHAIAIGPDHSRVLDMSRAAERRLPLRTSCA